MYVFLFGCSGSSEDSVSEGHRFLCSGSYIWIRTCPEWEVFWDIISFDLGKAFQYIRLPIDRTGSINLSILISISGKLIDGMIVSQGIIIER
jgi:hypothetical protein